MNETKYANILQKYLMQTRSTESGTNRNYSTSSRRTTFTNTFHQNRSRGKSRRVKWLCYR